MKKIIPFIILILFQGQILGQTLNSCNIEITTDKILIDNIKLLDSLTTQLDKITNEKPIVTFYYPKTKKRWKKTVYKKNGIEVYQIADTSVKADLKDVVLLKISPSKISSMKINGQDLNLKTLTCDELPAFIEKTFIDNFYNKPKKSLDISASNGQYFISFHFKKCKELRVIQINCTLK